MYDERTGEKTAIFLLGAAVGATIALLTAPASGARTRKRLARKGEQAADYFIGAGKALLDECEELYSRSGELAEDVSRELSGKYRALHEYTKHALDEAETILRRTKVAVSGR
jgi:gas vesicle protein